MGNKKLRFMNKRFEVLIILWILSLFPTIESILNFLTHILGVFTFSTPIFTFPILYVLMYPFAFITVMFCLLIELHLWFLHKYLCLHLLNPFLTSLLTTFWALFSFPKIYIWTCLFTFIVAQIEAVLKTGRLTNVTLWALL